MRTYFLDTSALVKLYVREPGTEVVARLADGSEDTRLAISSLAKVETHAALRAIERTGRVSAAVVQQLLTRFESDMGSVFTRQVVADGVLEMAIALVARHPLRAYDAVQLASCLWLAGSQPEPPIFVCSDKHLLEAAGAEGLQILDTTVT